MRKLTAFCLKIIFLLIPLTGCAYDNIVTTSNGETYHKVTCGMAVPEACNSKAAELCPNGYKIIQTETGNFFSMQPRILTISCK